MSYTRFLCSTGGDPPSARLSKSPEVLARSPAYLRKYEMRSLIVLTVVPTADAKHDACRLAQFLDWTEASPEAVLSAPIWQVAAKAGDRRLVG